MAVENEGASLFALRGTGPRSNETSASELLPLPEAVNLEIVASRAAMLATLARVDPSAKAIAILEVGSNDPTGRNLRVIESIRRSPRLSGLCRPIAVGSTADDRELADAAGAYAFVLTSSELDSKTVANLIERVATRVPRNLVHSRGPFIELGDPPKQERFSGDDFARVFQAHFSFEPGPLDLRIIRSWAYETPDKTLVDAIGEDPDSGWSESAVRRRIERLRDRAPVLYRDATGNLAKGRLARQFPPIPPDGDTDEFASWPDVDRCISLSADDGLMQQTFMDDGARTAFENIVSRRMVESQRRAGRPPAGSRLRQLSKDLEAVYEDAFNHRFADEAEFRAAVRRALFAIADAQLDGQQVA